MPRVIGLFVLVHALAGLAALRAPVEDAGRWPGGLPEERFTDGRREILIRRVAVPTRRLHPAADCMRALGYAVTPEPLVRDAHGRLMGRITCRRGSEALEVTEQILDERGQSWSDASAWYWAAVLGRTRGPWRAITAAIRTR